VHAIAAAAGAILGHLFSPYLKFSGGKGIATSAGAFAGLAPWAFGCALTVFAGVFATRRIVSLASLAAAVTLPIAVFVTPGVGLGERHDSVLWVTMIVMLVVIWKHRGNIRRLRVRGAARRKGSTCAPCPGGSWGIHSPSLAENRHDVSQEFDAER
jgi:glycerol-3-phosphate acyltransferase PlsY